MGLDLDHGATVARRGCDGGGVFHNRAGLCVHLLVPLIAFLAITAARGDDPRIVGPTDSVEARSVSWVTLEGLGPNDTATFFPSEQLQAGPPHIVPQHALFWSDREGKFQVQAIVVSVDWQTRQISLTPLTYSITVGSNPDPGPDPGPDPQPGQRWQIMLFHESGDLDSLPRGQVELLSSLKLRQELEAAGHYVAGVFDDDTSGTSGIPAALQPWFEAVKNDPMPRIALAPLAGGVVRDYPLPADRAGLMKFLEAPK